MSQFDYQIDNSLIDTCLNIDEEGMAPLLMKHMSSEKFIDLSQVKTQAPKFSSPITNPLKIECKNEQSNLHNCPKHLIKLINQCVGLGKQTSQEISDRFKEVQEKEIYENIKSLLEVLELVRRGKLKSFSKQLLKIVFQNNSQNISRLRLLQNPLIAKVFENSNPSAMCQAKRILRLFVAERLVTRKSNYNDRSKNYKKDINEKYLQIFLQELKAGRIKQRINKDDKDRILRECSSR